MATFTSCVEQHETRRFLSSTFGSISGTVFADANANGRRDSKEAVVAKAQVFLDSTNNGAYDKKTEPLLKTDKLGQYSFTHLVAGTYRVRDVGANNMVISAPSSGWFRITLRAGQRSTNRNLGNVKISHLTLASSFSSASTSATKNVTAPSLAALLGMVEQHNGSFAVGQLQFGSPASSWAGHIDLNAHDALFTGGGFNYDGAANGGDYGLLDPNFVTSPNHAQYAAAFASQTTLLQKCSDNNSISPSAAHTTA